MNTKVASLDDFASSFCFVGHFVVASTAAANLHTYESMLTTMRAQTARPASAATGTKIETLAASSASSAAPLHGLNSGSDHARDLASRTAALARSILRASPDLEGPGSEPPRDWFPVSDRIYSAIL